MQRTVWSGYERRSVQNRLLGADGVSRTYGSTSSAIGTCVRIDFVRASFADSVNRTFRLAASALDAVIGNLVGHGILPKCDFFHLLQTAEYCNHFLTVTG
jgi:hypothetical protein